MRARLGILAIVLAQSLNGQSLTGAAKWADSARKEIDAAAMSGGTTALVDVRTMLGRALVAFPNDALLLHYQGYATYRLLNVLSATKAPGELAALNDSARIFLERSIEKRPMAESYALLTAIYGRQINADPSLGMTLGMEIQRMSMEARGLGGRNPRVFLVAGQGAMFTPPEYGGGLDQALKLFTQAVELYVTDAPPAPEPSWGKAEAYAWLGQAYDKQGKKAEALAAYKKALEIEPGYSWVSYVLIPAASK